MSKNVLTRSKEKLATEIEKSSLLGHKIQMQVNNYRKGQRGKNHNVQLLDLNCEPCKTKRNNHYIGLS